MSTAIWTAITTALVSTLVGAFFSWYAGVRKRHIRVVRITNPDKQEDILSEALQVYDDEERISVDDKDDSEDIIRWLKEVRNEKAQGNCKLEDYFLVAKTGEHVSGMAYAHLYPSVQLAFFSYLIVPRPSERHPGSLGHQTSGRRVSSRLVTRLKNELLRSKRCKAVLAEVEDPNTITDSGRRTRAKARIAVLQGLANGEGGGLAVYRHPI